jgi:hypothetical protein
MTELGSIATRSTFVNSDCGDNAVFFKHCRSCQEDRKCCKHNQPLPQTDSTFRKSADLNGTCVSRRQDVVNYDATCPFLAGASNTVVGLESMETTDCCSTPDEHALEKTCPFAKALHPSFSSHGARHPLTDEDHLRNCEIEIIDTAASKGLVTAAKFPLVSMGCCRVSGECFEESMKDVALQSLCNMEDCRAKFEMAFPEIALETECASVDPVIECKFEIQAGPSMSPINLGFVTEACCAAATSHAAGGDETNVALGIICEEKSCVAARDSLFQQGQAFANPGSSATLEESCASMLESKEEPVDGEGLGSSAIASPPGRILALTVAACMSFIV